MGIEIERKFLVRKEVWAGFPKGVGNLYRQGYILTDPAKTIRVRLAGEKGTLTIKGITTGASRAEFEYSIPQQDAIELLDNFCSSTLNKIRYVVPFQDKTWEVDEFLGDNEGLVVAEIELGAEDESFDRPGWVDNEVTEDKRYYNSYIVENPFNTWK